MTLKRASPSELRNALMIVNELVKAGIMFVPVPVLDDADKSDLAAMLDSRIDKMAQAQGGDEA